IEPAADHTREGLQVGSDERLDVRIEGGRRGTFELAEFREYFVAHRRREVAQGAGHRPLVRRMEEREEERDGDGLRSGIAHGARDSPDLRLRGADAYPSVCVDAFTQTKAPLHGDGRVWAC